MEDVDDLGPATYKSNGAFGNRKLHDHFNPERQAFWEHHFPVSYDKDDATFYLDCFVEVVCKATQKYKRPGFVFAKAESSDSQHPTAAVRSSIEVHDMLAPAWPKSLPLFHDFWKEGKEKMVMACQNQLIAQLYRPQNGGYRPLPDFTYMVRDVRTECASLSRRFNMLTRRLQHDEDICVPALSGILWSESPLQHQSPDLIPTYQRNHSSDG